MSIIACDWSSNSEGERHGAETGRGTKAHLAADLHRNRDSEHRAAASCRIGGPGMPGPRRIVSAGFLPRLADTGDLARPGVAVGAAPESWWSRPSSPRFLRDVHHPDR